MPDTPSLSFTVRPWVKTGASLSAQMTLAATEGIESPIHPTPTHTKSASTNFDTQSPITRLTDNTTPMLSTTSSNPRSQTTTPTPTAPHTHTRHSLHTPESRWIPRSSLSLRSRDRHGDKANQTSPLRSRGATIPPCLPSSDPQSRFQTPDKSTRERGKCQGGDTAHADDSGLSYTPSMSGKQLAGWLSGLLGGRQ